MLQSPVCAIHVSWRSIVPRSARFDTRPSRKPGRCNLNKPKSEFEELDAAALAAVNGGFLGMLGGLLGGGLMGGGGGGMGMMGMLGPLLGKVMNKGGGGQ